MTGASLGYSGNYSYTSLNNVGNYGVWWSSTIRSSGQSYYLGVNIDDTMYPQYTSSKYLGRPVR
ncbi:hypothetical protein IKE88_03025 [Candidatus Saccharibacteria bacterium]|nr:hypothetical protein [Candidatus Saccharibacteria bacterium]